METLYGMYGLYSCLSIPPIPGQNKWYRDVAEQRGDPRHHRHLHSHSHHQVSQINDTVPFILMFIYEHSCYVKKIG